MSVLDPVRDRRSGRISMWALVGATGAVIDITITATLLGQMHYLLANVTAWSVAVSFNFLANWSLTYGRPDGRLARQYLGYVALSATTFMLRAATAVAGVELLGAPVLVASLAGIGVAASLNFLGCERIFGRAATVWTATIETAHDSAEFVFSTRLRSLLVATGMYNVMFRAYALTLTLLYCNNTRHVEINGATAELHTTSGTEIVSVLHTLEAERDVLKQWVDDIQPGDEVLDVGANLGIYSVLADNRGAVIYAVEPHEPTATRCARNFALNDVNGGLDTVALGRSQTTAALNTEIDEPGTQRASLTPGDSVQVLRGDDLDCQPDVIKIDTEGHEQAALAGLEQSLETVRLVVVEAHSADDERELRETLQAAGFRVERLTNGTETHLHGVKP